MDFDVFLNVYELVICIGFMCIITPLNFSLRKSRKEFNTITILNLLVSILSFSLVLISPNIFVKGIVAIVTLILFLCLYIREGGKL